MMLPRFKIILTLFVILLGPLLIGGCSSEAPTVEVSGVVTLDDKAFSNGTLWFVSPVQGTNYPAPLNSDGSYKIDIQKAEVGKTYTVHVGARTPKEGEKPSANGAGDVMTKLPDIPERYFTASTSELTATIKDSGPQTFNFALKSN